MAATNIAPFEQEMVPPLESGDNLDADEFMRRYEAMSNVKKAELIEGTVYIPSPVRWIHSASDTLLQGWLLLYAANTPGTEAGRGGTVRLGPRNVLQPDVQ